jgi:hypothetical protein
MKMALTRDFRQTVVSRVKKDPAFAQALLDEARMLLLNGDPDAAKLILRRISRRLFSGNRALERLLFSQGRNP